MLTNNSLAPLAEPQYSSVTPSDAEPIADELASIVRNDFITAENYRRFSGVEERILQAMRMRRYQYDPQDVGLIGAIDIYMGIGALKSRAAESWINDILLNAFDKPWTIKPDPIPDLPEWLKEQVVDALEMELESMGVPQDIRSRAKELKDAAQQYADKKAADAAKGMERKIDNQMTEGGWRYTFAQFITHFCTFPLAVLRGPLIEKKRRLNWDGNNIKEVEQVIYTDRVINPFDFYPAMNSTTTQDGSYIIERFQAQPSYLHSCIGLPGFDEGALREVLQEYGEDGFSEYLRPDYQRRYLEDKYQSTQDIKTIDTLIWNGRMQGNALLRNGVSVPDPQKYYEAEIWTVNNRTVRAILNPYPLQQRPVFATSFVKVPGSLWGEGLLDILRDTQRICNSAARSIVRNMSFSSGPIGEVDVSRLQEGEVPQDFTPYKLYHVQPDMAGSGKPAFHFENITNVTVELSAVFEKFMKLADDLSGIPAYVLGNPQLAGAGRTMGGLSMLMQNAAKGIKNCILNIDRDIIEPRVTMQYNLNMKYSDDPDIKGDAQIISSGASGLLQRELAQQKITEMMQIFMPYVQGGIIPIPGAQVLIREAMKNSGLPVDQIVPNPYPDNDLLRTSLARIGAPNLQGMQSGFSGAQPQLDNRNAAAALPSAQVPPQPTPQPATPTPSPGPVNMPAGA